MSPTNSELLLKYDRPVPRYTSYPTVPYWKGISNEAWLEAIELCKQDTAAQGKTPISLYVHVPFCRTLCSFCGCNKVISRDYSKAKPFMDGVLRELDLKLAASSHTGQGWDLKELHFGGGTPTWLPAPQMDELMSELLKRFGFSKTDKHTVDIAIEVDPRTINQEHIDVLQARGVTRVSLGVQDFNAETLRAIKRDQPYSLVENCTLALRKAGITSLNFDLVYGLPYQTQESIAQTIDQVVGLRPSRIALYSYAHIPDLKKAQQGVEKHGLPLPAEKRALYETSRRLLMARGYMEIGMDHFALVDDELSVALKENRLHRNFMGYTVQKSKLLFGLGPSSLSDAWYGFYQNEKDAGKWLDRVVAGDISPMGGHRLSADDLHRRAIILDLMCNYKSRLNPELWEPLKTTELYKDGFLKWDTAKSELTVNEAGRPFIRNVCVEFDSHFLSSKNGQPRFSKSI